MSIWGAIDDPGLGIWLPGTYEYAPSAVDKEYERSLCPSDIFNSDDEDMEPMRNQLQVLRSIWEDTPARPSPPNSADPDVPLSSQNSQPATSTPTPPAATFAPSPAATYAPSPSPTPAPPPPTPTSDGLHSSSSGSPVSKFSYAAAAGGSNHPQNPQNIQDQYQNQYQQQLALKSTEFPVPCRAQGPRPMGRPPQEQQFKFQPQKFTPQQQQGFRPQQQQFKPQHQQGFRPQHHFKLQQQQFKPQLHKAQQQGQDQIIENLQQQNFQYQQFIQQQRRIIAQQQQQQQQQRRRQEAQKFAQMHPPQVLSHIDFNNNVINIVPRPQHPNENQKQQQQPTMMNVNIHRPPVMIYHSTSAPFGTPPPGFNVIRIGQPPRPQQEFVCKYRRRRHNIPPRLQSEN